MVTVGGKTVSAGSETRSAIGASRLERHQWWREAAVTMAVHATRRHPLMAERTSLDQLIKLASYRQCVQRIEAAWPAFEARRRERLR